MKVQKYTRSSHKNSNKDIISAGTCDDNSKIIKLNKFYKNPKFYEKRRSKNRQIYIVNYKGRN
jgi:hypothetical protein